ncbi:alpha/beta fold hydrolase [Pollutimonas thiosulfatoxidans]|uniref:Esterase n=1 Tax=Pollutimonas thiosulfatoxidans TaxID=2028345 RepID=A0A410GA46_9BURK|nr:alpha/beta fold hydrolase [Pollutimonas thiosulfatoxidans]NYT44920.1 alpha/beta hydrolase [Alcaligenaceae bacterium]QAA93151.1 esterase [Pollutimonas thiosulfatoxidans]
MTDSKTDSHTFVLVHGAWHGGWCWSRVAARLRNKGHEVYTPTLTGLGERSHLLGPDITLNTFVQDITNVLLWEDLHNVILVGHSFGGLVIAGVADQHAGRVQQLVFLDAFLLENGMATFDTLPADVVQKLRDAARQPDGSTPTLRPPRPASLALTEPADALFVQGRLTPHPLSTYESPLMLSHPLGNGLPATYLSCVNPAFPAVDDAKKWVRANTSFSWMELDAGHDAMVSAAGVVADTLLQLASS